MSDVTQLLREIESGNLESYDTLVPLIYQQLHRIAQSRMNRERADHTLSATSLVNEAFLRLVKVSEDHQWDNRVHFFSAAAEAMRRILIDHARKKNAAKRGADLKRDYQEMSDLPQIIVQDGFDSDDLIALDTALTELEKEDPESAEVVKLRFFAGLTREQVGHQLGLSKRTVDFRWSFARAWLKRQIKEK